MDATVEGLLGVQELPPPLQGGVGLVYLCRHVGGDLRPRDTETDAARYVGLQALDALAEPKEPWSDWLIRRLFAGALTVTAMPGAHGMDEITFLLEASGAKVFFGGDSLLTPELKEAAKQVAPVDVALPAVNGLRAMGSQKVMNAEEAAELVGEAPPVITTTA